MLGNGSGLSRYVEAQQKAIRARVSTSMCRPCFGAVSAEDKQDAFDIADPVTHF